MNHRSPSTEAPQASGFRDEASELARLGKSLLPRAVCPTDQLDAWNRDLTNVIWLLSAKTAELGRYAD
jgi:hypothetical protein